MGNFFTLILTEGHKHGKLDHFHTGHEVEVWKDLRNGISPDLTHLFWASCLLRHCSQ